MLFSLLKDVKILTDMTRSNTKRKELVVKLTFVSPSFIIIDLSLTFRSVNKRRPTYRSLIVVEQINLHGAIMQILR